MFEDLLGTSVDIDDLWLRTENCLVCLKPATEFTGHVLKGTKRVTAGWCKEHSRTPGWPISMSLLGVSMGCYGGWHEKYGIQIMEDD